MDFGRKISAKLNSIMYKKSSGDKTSYNRLVRETQKAKPRLARRGCVAIYVGKEGEEPKRYNIPIKFLSFPTLQELIMEDDIDMKIDGPIRLCCSTAYFDQLLEHAK